MPDIALSTDVIVGFPGETEADFLETLDLVDRVGYNQVFTFIYSPRSGTPAASFDGMLPREIVQDRFDRLFEVVQKRAFEANQRYAGQTVRVLVEGPSKRDDGIFAGRSPQNLNVHAKVPDGMDTNDMAGSFVDVKVTTPKTWYLFGEVA